MYTRTYSSKRNSTTVLIKIMCHCSTFVFIYYINCKLNSLVVVSFGFEF